MLSHLLHAATLAALSFVGGDTPIACGPQTGVGPAPHAGVTTSLPTPHVNVQAVPPPAVQLAPYYIPPGTQWQVPPQLPEGPYPQQPPMYPPPMPYIVPPTPAPAPMPGTVEEMVRELKQLRQREKELTQAIREKIKTQRKALDDAERETSGANAVEDGCCPPCRTPLGCPR